jgi:glycerol-3-phosphate dehydrogenase (NAD(P)+)
LSLWSCSHVPEELIVGQNPVDLNARVGSQFMIAVLGGGAMGAALAVRWATAGAEVALLGTDFDTPVLAAVRDGRAHPALGVSLHPALTYRSFHEWESVLAEADVVVVALSSAGLRDLVTIGARSARADATWVIATKGWQEDTFESPSEVVGSILGSRQRTVSLAGPALAAEVVAGAPTAFLFAAHDAELGKRVARSLRSNTTATVVTDDVVGAETASAYKNVVAIAVGMCEGLSERFAESALNRTFANGRAAVFAQGMTDMVRLVEAKGGRASTVLGLAGAGDLYVTCLGGRNGRFGRLVGAGATPEQALKAIGSTVEGTANTRAALALASKLMIDLPTARTVDLLLREEIAGQEGFQRLLALFAMALSSIGPPST